MKKYKVIRAVSHVYFVDAESLADAEEKVVNQHEDVVLDAVYDTDDIYTEEI